MSIKRFVKKIQNIMRKDPNIDGDAQRLTQISWLLFLKSFQIIENNLGRDKTTSSLTKVAFANESGDKIIADDLRWQTWTKDVQNDDLETLTSINNNLFLPLQKIIVDTSDKTRESEQRIIQQIFSSLDQLICSPTVLSELIDVIDNQFTQEFSAKTHLIGDIYETILGDLRSAGNAGEFYTPRPITRFMVEMLQPKIGEIIMDPACGTGGFLLDVMKYLREHNPEIDDMKELNKTIRGVEKKKYPYQLCLTNMMLNNLTSISDIRLDNLLQYNLDSHPNEIDKFLSNPPFGGHEERRISVNFPEQLYSRDTADLFLVLMMKLLKDGGQAAVILPNGFLFGEGVKTRIKIKLLAENDLHTIIRLPTSVFSPYTNVATNILFFEKGKPTSKIWFHELVFPDHIKSFSKSNPITDECFSEIKNWWSERRESTNAWIVNLEQLKANNYNLDLLNPNTVEEKHDLQKLFDDDKKQSNDIQKILERLKQTFLHHLKDEFK